MIETTNGICFDKTCLRTNLHIKNFHRGKGSGKLEIERARSEVDGTHRHAKYKRTQHRHDRLQINRRLTQKHKIPNLILTQTHKTPNLILTVFHVSESDKSHYLISPTILH